MKTHILFSEGLQTPELTFVVKQITEDWQRNCNNFKGTYAECTNEGERMKVIASERQRVVYTEPHYPNAEYGSIFDY